MDEYIKREAAENAIRNDLPLSTWMKRSVDKAMHSMGVTVATIDAIPAADVVPVRHGKWDCFIDFVTCSLCGYTSTDRDNRGDPVSLNYCPNCGAKMDGGANDV